MSPLLLGRRPCKLSSLLTFLADAAGLISFVFLKPTCRWLIKKGWGKQPFTAQENTVSQTFAMAMTGSSAACADNPIAPSLPALYLGVYTTFLAMPLSHVHPSVFGH
jgi:hypothetical protein